MKMKKMSFAAALAAAALCPMFSQAAETAVPAAPQAAAAAAPEVSLDAIRSKLMGRIGTSVTKVSPSPIPGLYEAVIGQDIVYVDPTADHIVMGQIFNTLTRKNLTEASKEQLMRIDFSALPFKDAIKTVKGDGSRTIAVFSDPKCGFCKQLEANLKEMNNVTIYTFLFPVITATSKEASANIWCAKDPSQAWKEAMTEGKEAPKRSESCDISALDRNVSLGNSMGVTGTPTVFVPSGARAPGAAGVAYLEELLAASEQK
jgi:thiol:disulfide interchange protein DsbC